MAAGTWLRTCVTGASPTAIPPTQVCGEQHRFEKLMKYFRNKDSNINFMMSSGAQPGLGHSQVQVAARDLGIWDLGCATAEYED